MPKRLLKKISHIADSLFGLYYVFYWWDGVWFWNVLEFYVCFGGKNSFVFKVTFVGSIVLDLYRNLCDFVLLCDCYVVSWNVSYFLAFSQVFTWRFCFIFPPMFWFWEWHVYVKTTGEDMWFNRGPSGGVGPRSLNFIDFGACVEDPLGKRSQVALLWGMFNVWMFF